MSEVVVELTDAQFQALLWQAYYGETETVLAAVKRDPRLATRANESGIRLLSYACQRGRLELARGLLVLGAQINARDSDGWDALMTASRNGHLTVVGLLLSKGADSNSRSADQTALSVAAAYDHLEICILLVSRAADLLEIVSNGQTALDLYGFGWYIKSHPRGQEAAPRSSPQGLRRGPAPKRSLGPPLAICVCPG